MSRLAAGAVAVGIALYGCAPEIEVPSTASERASPQATGALVFGSVSANAGGEHEIFEPFADYVVSMMSDVGIGRARVIVAESLNAMVDRLRDGTVDVFIDSPFPVVYVSKSAPIEVVMRRWKRGVDMYSGVVFCRADSGAESLEDLRGRMIAFGSSYSTSSYLMPKSEMASRGLDLEHYQDAAATVPADRIGYVFSNDAESTMLWVLKGKVQAGAVNKDYFADLAGVRRDELRVLYTTGEMPRNLVCVRAGLEDTVKERLQAVLLELDETERGREILRDFEETLKFERFSGASESAMDTISRLLPYVEEDLGQ
ncbi:MAG: phosphate/phosphite/phosphonate ABC transporter substrate-binding protein [Holophagae bacterium]